MTEQQPPSEDAGNNDAPAAAVAAAAPPRDLDFEGARLAYSIIESLLEHTAVLSDLVALMARVIDEDTTRALTGTPNWSAYLESRRRMEGARADVEKFTDLMKHLSENK